MNISRNRIILCIIAVLALIISAFFVGTNTTHAATGDIIASYNFEDGRLPPEGIGHSGRVPPVILTDPDGNHFLRMTASPEDMGDAFATIPPTSRSELDIGSVVRPADNPITYSFSFRLNSAYPPSGHIAQLYQASPLCCTTIMADGNSIGGWVASAYADAATGVVGVAVKKSDPSFPLSNATGETLEWALQYNRWVNVSLTVYFDLYDGRVDITVDGQYKGSINGRTILHPEVSDRTYTYIDVYGDPSVIDFDNIILASGSSGP